MNRTNITVSDGYKIFEEKSLYDLENILKVLKEDNSIKIISAVIKEDKIEVVKQYWLCPVCGHKHYIERNSRISADSIEDRITCPNLFYFPNVLIAECRNDRKPIYFCEKCDNVVTAENKEYNFAVSCHNNIIKTELEIDDIESLLSTQILDGDITNLINELPVYECLYLDLNKGNVTLQIENSKGDVFSKVNGINEIQTLKGGQKELLPETPWQGGFGHLAATPCRADVFPWSSPSVAFSPPAANGLWGRHGQYSR